MRPETTARIIVIVLIVEALLLAGIFFAVQQPGTWEYEVTCAPDYSLDTHFEERGAAGWRVEGSRRVTDCRGMTGYEFIWGRPG